MNKSLNVKKYKSPYKRKDKYYDWIEQLHYEISSLSNAVSIWNKINNKELPTEIIEWQEENFIYRTILQITSLLECSYKKDDRSLSNFLIEIRNKNIISFIRYKKLRIIEVYESSNLTEKDLIDDFEFLTKQKYSDACFCKMINNDLELLKIEYEKYKKYRNKIIAHITNLRENTATEFSCIINSDNIVISVNFIDKIINKYSKLLYGYFKIHNEDECKF